jgi:hypothetical protein
LAKEIKIVPPLTWFDAPSADGVDFGNGFNNYGGNMSSPCIPKKLVVGMNGKLAHTVVGDIIRGGR